MLFNVGVGIFQKSEKYDRKYEKRIRVLFNGLLIKINHQETVQKSQKPKQTSCQISLQNYQCHLRHHWDLLPHKRPLFLSNKVCVFLWLDEQQYNSA